MALREIVTLPADILRKKARKVTDFGPDLQTLIDDMVETISVSSTFGFPDKGVITIDGEQIYYNSKTETVF